MNLKDFGSVTAVLPLRYINDEGTEVMAKATVLIDRREGQTSFTILGRRHSNAFMDMILTQQITGLTLNQQEAQPGFPGNEVEVTMEPSSVEEIPNEELCMNHIPLQHRDGKEPWCRRCGRNKDYNEPRQDMLGGRPPQIGESFRRYQEGLNVVEEEHLEGP